TYAAEFADGATAEASVETIPAPETVPQDWTVTFQKERGAPEGEIAFDQLISWTERLEAGIKYFSGTAIYEKSVHLSAERLQEDRRVWLDLGQVEQLAEVSVNGTSLGVLWKKPFKVDITDVVHPGANHVQVKVTNCWKNRILGDWKLPADQKITWTLYPFYHDDKDAPLMPSGLLGPVRLLSSESVTLKP
ncbi:MAG: glycoside hydrolase, partial [Opitutae bacterium]|nr:glycoside hydrolase [Opitutae bacterium]